MITRVGLVDGLTPAVAAWLKDFNPAARRTLLTGGRIIRRRAVQNIRGVFRRTGLNRTGSGSRGVRVRAEQTAGIPSVRVWHGSGILAAHELGSTIPAVTLRPRARRTLAWGGPRGGPHTQFARIISRRAFALPRRPTLIPAYEANASAILTLLEEEYQKLLNLAPPAVRS